MVVMAPVEPISCTVSVPLFIPEPLTNFSSSGVISAWPNSAGRRTDQRWVEAMPEDIAGKLISGSVRNLSDLGTRPARASPRHSGPSPGPVAPEWPRRSTAWLRAAESRVPSHESRDCLRGMYPQRRHLVSRLLPRDSRLPRRTSPPDLPPESPASPPGSDTPPPPA